MAGEAGPRWSQAAAWDSADSEDEQPTIGMAAILLSETSAIAQCTFFLILGVWLCWLRSPGTRSGPSRINTAQLIFWFPLNWMMLAAAISGSLALYQTADQRWFGSTPSSETFLRLYISGQLMGAAVEKYKERICRPGERRKRHFTVVKERHHQYVMVCCALGLILRRMHFWACLGGVLLARLAGPGGGRAERDIHAVPQCAAALAPRAELDLGMDQRKHLAFTSTLYQFIDALDLVRPVPTAALSGLALLVCSGLGACYAGAQSSA